jgi:hypothetical protein
MTRTSRSPTAQKADQSGASSNWWTKPYRIVQTNLRLIDVKQSPAKIARDVKAFGADAIVSNIGGIVAFYPTELELQWTNPLLEGRDFVAEMIAAARAEGLIFIGRFDLSKAMELAYREHPDWFMKNRDGGPRIYEGTYQACPNGDWGRRYGEKILTEALQRYEVDGVFFNMPGYPTHDYAAVQHGPCTCDNCHRRFAEMYGYDLPLGAAPGTRENNDYLEFQSRTTRELALANYRAVKAVQPNVAVFGTDDFNEVGRWEVQRRYWYPLPEWVHQSGEQSQYYQARNPGAPFTSTSTAHMDYPWRQVLETASYHLLRFAQQIATGAYLDLYLMGTFDDQDDKRFVPAVKELFDWYGRNSTLYDGSRIAGRVGLYRSEATTLLGGGTASAAYRANGFRGAYRALSDARIPFQFIDSVRVNAGKTLLSTADFDAVILPNAALLSSNEAEALDAYVEAGGLVIATGETGAYDERGSRRTGSAMQTSPVAMFGEPVSAHGWTFDTGTGPFPFSGAHVPADGKYYPVEPRAGVESLLARARAQRFGPPEFSFADPAVPPSGETGALIARHGAGASVHLPWLPEWQYHRDGMPDLRNLFKALLDNFAKLQRFKLEGAGRVELTVQARIDGSWLLHVINYSGQHEGTYDEPAEIHGLRLGVLGSISGGVAAHVSDRMLTTTSAPDSSGYIWIELPPIKYFEAVTVSIA